MVMGLVMPLLLGEVTNVTIIHRLCRLYPQLLGKFAILVFLNELLIIFQIIFNLHLSVNLSSPLLHCRQINYSFYTTKPNSPLLGLLSSFSQLFQTKSKKILTNSKKNMESYGCGFAPTLDEKDSANHKLKEKNYQKKLWLGSI